MLFDIKYAPLPWASASTNVLLDQDLLESMQARFIKPQVYKNVHCKYIFTDMSGTTKEWQLSSGCYLRTEPQSKSYW